MSAKVPTYQLRTGYQIPKIGFGTWEITPDLAAKDAVNAALKTGYRLIDTAKIYGNEKGVGEALAESGIERKDLFVTTKVWNDDQGYESTLKACQASLKKLQLEYLDLYLIHWPATSKRHDSWRAMEQLVADGLIRSAGVCNYTVEHLQELLQRSELLPAVNQVEFHPFIYEQQKAVLEFCRKQTILVEAYSPISRLRGTLPDIVKTIAQKYHVSPQRLVLRWCLEQGTLPLPRSTSAEHNADNFDIFDFEITNDDMQLLAKLSDGERVTWDPAGMG
jgi:diketogulonate reductase-like aldo/keto reductase